MRLLELKGLPVSMLIEFVHRHGGILGPAHPYGAKYMSMTNTKRYRKSQEFVKRFDFIEVFNACESQESNDSAARLAAEYGKPGGCGVMPTSQTVSGQAIRYFRRWLPVRRSLLI